MRKILLAVGFICICISGLCQNGKWSEREQMFGLKGPVKTAYFDERTITFPSGTVRFTEDGECLTLKENLEEPGISVTRDGKGRVKNVKQVGGGETNYYYNDEEAKYNPGRLISIGYTLDNTVTTWSLDNDYEGNMISQVVDAVTFPSKEEKGVYIEYEVLERDKYGNWLKRKTIARERVGRGFSEDTEERVETCRLEYFPESAGYTSFAPTQSPSGQNKYIIEEEVTEPSVDYNAVFDAPETLPGFPGGENALFRQIYKILRYPLIAQENGKQGTVVVGFIIEKDGSVSNVKVNQGVDPSLDKEAVRVISSLPKFTPGKVNGRPVRTSMTLPVRFKLN